VTAGPSLTAVNRQVAQLRGLSVAAAAEQLPALLADLTALVADDRYRDESVINLVIRAHRAIRPRAPRIDDRDQALAALRAAIEEGPRTPGRPAKQLGSPIPVRLYLTQQDAVRQQARHDGHVDALGEPVWAEIIRTLVDEALAARRHARTAPERGELATSPPPADSTTTDDPTPAPPAPVSTAPPAPCRSGRDRTARSGSAV